MKNWKVSTKLIAVLAAPLLVLVALAYIGISERTNEASDAERAEQLTELARGNSTLVHELQREALFSGAFMASGGQAAQTELETQRQNTQTALASLRGTLDDFSASDEDESFRNAIETANTRLDDLDTVRNAVDGQQMSVLNATQQLSDTSEALIDVNAEIAQATKTPALASALDNYVEFSQSKQEASISGAVLAAVLERNPQLFVDGSAAECTTTEACAEFALFQSALQSEDDRKVRFEERATPDQKSLLRNKTSSEDVREAESILNEALLAGDALDDPREPGEALPEVGVEPPVWLEAGQAKLIALLDVENSLLGEIVTDADDLTNTANREVTLFVVVALIAILVSVILALLVARATARPLQKLTVAANRLSTEQLPSLVEQLRNPESAEESGLAQEVTPIDIDSRDEIGQLADAFNTIQQVTLEVAEEQSSLLRKGIGDIFVNLARRNQTLLDRQIEFIDQLEANEEDPDQLDNLFKLDHLATRMRRNAESLLVLAGAEPPRRRGRPVALADVVRVAIGEVEDFARISLLALDEAMVGGNVAVDLAHLLSELMENATHFSPPDTHVEVVGRIEPDGTYAVTVTDQGIGMSSEQLAEANHQLAHPPLVGLALSRSLGFIVIGRLAQRFHTVVELEASPSGGVAALVTLPTELVTDNEGEPLPIDPAYAAELEPAPEPEIGSASDANEMEPPDGEGEADDDLAALAAVAAADTHEGEGEAETVEPEALAEDEEYEIVEEIVLEEDFDPSNYDDDVEIIEEIVEVEVDEEELAVDDLADEPATLDEAVPEGDAFDKGLESLIAGDAPEAPDEPVPVPEPEPEPEPAPEPVSASAEVDSRPPAAPPVTTDITAAGLVKRTPKKQKEGGGGTGPLRTAATTQRPTGSTHRSPEEVRKMLSRYRGGLKRGREGDEPKDDA